MAERRVLINTAPRMNLDRVIIECMDTALWKLGVCDTCDLFMLYARKEFETYTYKTTRGGIGYSVDGMLAFIDIPTLATSTYIQIPNSNMRFHYTTCDDTVLSFSISSLFGTTATELNMQNEILDAFEHRLREVIEIDEHMFGGLPDRTGSHAREPVY